MRLTAATGDLQSALANRMMSELVSVARFLTREQAEIARAALEQAGIEATVHADDAGGMVPLPNGVDVKVLSEHAAAARAIVEPEDRATREPDA